MIISNILSNQKNSQAAKGCGLQKKGEIQGGSQEMAIMVG